MPLPVSITTLLLDIEGTTTPVDFVFKVLFPYARDRVADFLATQGADPEVQADLDLLRQEYAQEAAAELPDWAGEDAIAAVPYIQWLIDSDRKSTGLKSLQGKIWEQGYVSGEIKGQLFADVLPAFQRWQAAGLAIAIFSSGSVQAQQLLFGYSEAGDLSPHLSGYFDTRTGPKREAASYGAIAAQLGKAPAQVLFVSDIPAELEAAATAGFQTRLSLRPGNATVEIGDWTTIHSFDEL
ncbi:acireductone synthase [Synechococcus elongatus]|uniref:Enolase-phosphatase E1 n=2 Tax=Synechococcus elongatus TaxID=32046 RepID=MTNC_SYNE7|nr:acireductone synthase [Synechococcus elongatus]Q31LP5.1 RecName: Full=Enolase-phosphatase E1; AltName: Full=2,3-diketo-5-methylthio-1-phosphopentane phosphatase [Synechococcus elongatus PCC 7942 = FACHB-805]Q5N078.1 RecName: Full=Enolase-phosphatase E1; AltName: Full=2,3-diketo-5-methylthio-1-phosphopentane phosphatase [Synechococcus elongatus PCC 6301]ABB58024.1 2,3-diketo-5-methylthio-1-phosphopentane phosphatase [Synechococcus elongatus PCC 7942 = FACHB-805]AJD57498.1 enolase [Synechococc